MQSPPEGSLNRKVFKINSLLCLLVAPARSVCARKASRWGLMPRDGAASRCLLVPLIALLLLLSSVDASTRKKKSQPHVPPEGYTKIKHTVVIFLEGWSFESLLPEFRNVPHVDVINQTSKEGFRFSVLPPPLVPGSNGSRVPDPRFPANASVEPFDLSQYFASSTISPPLVQRFWQEQYQINDGKMDKFVAWTDAGGLPLGYVNSTTLPLTSLAMEEGSILAGVHHSVYGGAFINLMYLTCATIPQWTNAPSSYEFDWMFVYGCFNIFFSFFKGLYKCFRLLPSMNSLPMVP